MNSDDVPPRPDGPHPQPLPAVPVAPERPKATWRWWEAVGVYFVFSILSSIVTLPLLEAIHPSGLANLAASAVIAVVNVGLLLVWLSRFHPTWRGVVGLPTHVWPEARAGLVFGVVLYPAVVFGAGLIMNLLLQALSGQQVRAPRQLPAHLSTIGVAVSVVYAVVIAPIHEELFFRGILFRALRDRYGFGIGATGSGLAFGLIHYLPGAVLNSVLLMSVMMFTGIALAYLYERRGTIAANVVAHATFNVIGLVLILALR